MSESAENDVIIIPSGESAWTVLHVRSRCEKKVADYCRTKCFSVFLPLIARTRIYEGRKRIYSSPLFPGYVFALLDKAGCGLLRGNDNVANVLEVLDQAALVTQLEQIRRALDTKGAVELLPEFKTGMKVQIKHGPMKGAEGFIERMKSQTRIILNVDFIKQSIALEVDTDSLLPV